MADTFRNPYNYTSPIGAALADLTRTIISGPSRAEKIKAAEEMLKVKRANESMLALQEGIRGFGGPTFNLPDVAASAIGAGMSGADLGDYNLVLSADGKSWDDPSVDAAFRGAGGAASGTAGAFKLGESNENMRAANALAETQRNNIATLSSQDQRAANALAEQKRQFDMDPLAAVVNGQPVYVPQSGAFGAGVAPVLSETENKALAAQTLFPELSAAEQRRYIGVDPSMSDFANLVSPTGTVVADPAMMQSVVGQPGYSVVGKEGAAGGRDITTSTQTSLEGANIGIDRATRMLDYVEGLALKDPTNFGLVGEVKGLGQDVGQMAESIATGLGYTGMQDAINEIQRDAMQSGVAPTTLQRIFTFDPTLGELQGAYGMLVYALAEGVAGQAGRELSDGDVARAQAAFGDPRALFSSQATILSKIKAARTMLGINRDVVDSALGNGPQPGAVEDGYRFRGGDPADPANWEQVQ